MKTTVIIPVYNEANTLTSCIGAVYDRNPGRDLEVIVVDDGSTDATSALVKDIRRPSLRIFRHEKNLGKGAAIRTGLAAATGDIVLIQDADLEYDPADYSILLKPFSDGSLQVVYGSRSLKAGNFPSYGRFYWGGRFLSWLTNLLFGSSITDEPTCYKAFRTELLRSLDLRCDGFEFCPEVTGKILRRGIRIHEVPISYRPRSIEEGKKIRWHDGLLAIWTLLRIRCSRK